MRQGGGGRSAAAVLRGRRLISAIVQARMGSARLPGKVLRRAAGKTFLEHLVERLRSAETLDRIVVATSDLPGDAPIVQLCEQHEVACFRGSERDVLDRYYQAALHDGADTVVRITADCPLVDPGILDDMVRYQQGHEREFDLVTNRHPLTFPDGLDVDVMPIAALESAWRSAKTPHQREHVIPWFWESGQRIFNVEHSDNLFARHRWTVDYEEDATLVAAIFEHLYAPGRVFGLNDILGLLERQPSLREINATYLPRAA